MWYYNRNPQRLPFGHIEYDQPKISFWLLSMAVIRYCTTGRFQAKLLENFSLNSVQGQLNRRTQATAQPP